MICIWYIFKNVFTFFPCEYASITPFIWIILTSLHLSITPYFSYTASSNNLQLLQILCWHTSYFFEVWKHIFDDFIQNYNVRLHQHFQLLRHHLRHFMYCHHYYYLFHWRAHHSLDVPSSLQAESNASHLWRILPIQASWSFS